MTTRSSGPPGPRAAIPAYWAPPAAGQCTGGLGQPWEALFGRAHPPALVVVNPASGPGPARDERYACLVRALTGRGARVIGYVDTAYGRRDAALVRAEVDRYRQWYPELTGVFLDQAAAECSTPLVEYYAGVAGYVRAPRPGSTVVLNHGRVPPQDCYMRAADVALTAEDGGGAYLESHGQVPDWVSRYPAGRFWHVVHSTPPERWPDVRAAARRRHAGLLYVTDRGMPNPYDALPSYWARERAELAQ